MKDWTTENTEDTEQGARRAISDVYFFVLFVVKLIFARLKDFDR